FVATNRSWGILSRFSAVHGGPVLSSTNFCCQASSRESLRFWVADQFSHAAPRLWPSHSPWNNSPKTNSATASGVNAMHGSRGTGSRLGLGSWTWNMHPGGGGSLGLGGPATSTLHLVIVLWSARLTHSTATLALPVSRN